MQLKDIIQSLSLEIYNDHCNLDSEVIGGYTSDLLSDVMGNADSGKIWITLQTHKNVIAVASLKELAAVLLINGNKPEADMLEQANEEGIPILGTPLKAFEISGKLYNLINK